MKKTKSKFQVAKKMSEDALSVIHTTIESLKAANVQIDEAQKENDDKIVALQVQNNALCGMKTTNEKVVANLEAIFN